MSAGWTKGRLCSVPRCGRKHSGLGYCRKHHGQWVRLGRLLPPHKEYGNRGGPRPCLAPKCHAFYHGKCGGALGMCSRHYQQIRTHGCLTPWLERPKIQKGATCDALGCNKPVYAKGACSRHYWIRYSAGIKARIKARSGAVA